MTEPTRWVDEIDFDDDVAAAAAAPPAPVARAAETTDATNDPAESKRPRAVDCPGLQPLFKSRETWTAGQTLHMVAAMFDGVLDGLDVKHKNVYKSLGELLDAHAALRRRVEVLEKSRSSDDGQ